MGTVQNKPILHGRDHATNGPDPIPGMSGGGLQFDTDNEGGWLYVQTNDETEAGGSLYGFGVDFRDVSAGGIRLKTFAGLLLEAATTATLWSHGGITTVQSDLDTTYPDPSIWLRAPTGTVKANCEGFQADASGLSILELQPSGAVSLSGNAGIALSSGGDISVTSVGLGFYGVTPVVQAAHPTTLGDVITALTDLGLTA